MSWNGIPGLSSIPILKYLFGSKDHTIQDNELVFLVVPHIVRSQVLSEANLRTIDTGVGNTSIDLRHVSIDGATAAPREVPPANAAPEVSPAHHSSAVEHRNVGVVPGQSALAAVPAAMAQLHASADVNGETAISAAAGHAPPSPFAGAGPSSPTAPSASGQSRPFFHCPGFTHPGASCCNAGFPGPLAPAPGSVCSRRRKGCGSLSFKPPSAPVAIGATFQVPVVVADGADISSVAVQVKYDPARLSLVNVSPGDYLSRDGQSASPVHSDDDGAGVLNVVASRPPGAAGVGGPGTVYVLSFQAKAAGETVLNMVRAAAGNSAQQPIQTQGGQTTIVVK